MILINNDRIIKKGDIIKINADESCFDWYHENEMVVIDVKERQYNDFLLITNYNFSDYSNDINMAKVYYVSNINERRLKKLKSI
ncbi:hypothetical protein M0Q50_10085 [bacterium]|jgi:hypothetical protein|nr:hypothetical protein [bacterium]